MWDTKGANQYRRIVAIDGDEVRINEAVTAGDDKTVHVYINQLVAGDIVIGVIVDPGGAAIAGSADLTSGGGGTVIIIDD